jgi:hypothetical protein
MRVVLSTYGSRGDVGPVAALAADPILGPWQEPAELDVLKTGAWIDPCYLPVGRCAVPR